MGRPKKERTVEAATGKGTFQQLLAQTKAELQDTEQKRVKLNFSVCVNNEITIAQRISTNYGRDKIYRIVNHKSYVAIKDIYKHAAFQAAIPLIISGEIPVYFCHQDQVGKPHSNFTLKEVTKDGSWLLKTASTCAGLTVGETIHPSELFCNLINP